MMHNLADRPATCAIWRVDLLVREAADGGAQTLREEAQRLDVSGANLGQAAGRSAETASRKPKVFQFTHGSDFTRFLAVSLQTSGGAARPSQ